MEKLTLETGRSAESGKPASLCGRKVALVYSGCHRRGGVERVVWESANHLQRSGYDCSVLASELPSAEQMCAGVQLHRVRDGGLPWGLGLPVFQSEARRAIERGRFDLVGGFGVQAPEGSVLWVQSVHAAWWVQCLRRRTGFLRLRQQWNPFHRVVLQMERRMFGGRNYRRLIALTSEVRADLERFYGVPPADVEVLPNGFSPREFHPGVREVFRGEMREKLRIDPGAWVVLFVANEWERKGLLPLMEALGSWRQRDVHLIVAGRLPVGRLMPQAERWGLSGRVHFVGGGEDVNRWFGAADAFALPTLYEAWGMVIVEALACGLPVLTSASAGAAVAVRQGVTGVLLDDPLSVSEVRAGLIRLRQSQHPSPSLIAASVAAYRWETVLERYEQILEGAR